MAVSFGHGLDLTTFKVQKQTASGGWSTVTTLTGNQKYRYKMIFTNKNTSSYMPPYTEPHAYLDLYVIGIKKASYEEYYYDDTFTTMVTGPDGKPSGFTNLNGGKILPQKTGTYYFYFIWKGPQNVPLPPPGVKITVGIYSAVHKGKPTIPVVPLI